MLEGIPSSFASRSRTAEDPAFLICDIGSLCKPIVMILRKKKNIFFFKEHSVRFLLYVSTIEDSTFPRNIWIRPSCDDISVPEEKGAQNTPFLLRLWNINTEFYQF
jgi:hypothetical protein